MKTLLAPLLAWILLAVFSAHSADFLESLGLKKPKAGTSTATPALAALTQDEIGRGLKEALGKGVQQAVTSLGTQDGFLKDLAVRIPMPKSLAKAEKVLRSFGQDQLADEFVTTMNRAAEKAVPEAAAVLGQSIQQMTLTDARAILSGTNNAATAFFRRTSETNLFERFHPIVQKATADTGVTGAYKRMMDKAGFAAALAGLSPDDIDAHVTHKAIDGLFVKIAEEEKRIRTELPARTTGLLQKVFGALEGGAAKPQ